MKGPYNILVWRKPNGFYEATVGYRGGTHEIAESAIASDALEIAGRIIDHAEGDPPLTQQNRAKDLLDLLHKRGAERDPALFADMWPAVERGFEELGNPTIPELMKLAYEK